MTATFGRVLGAVGLLVAAIAATSIPGAAARTPAATITMDAYLQGQWPSRPGWSPDGRYISFLWTDWVTQQLFVARPDGETPQVMVKSTGFLGGPTWNSAGDFGEWSPDGTRMAYADGGDLYMVSVPDGVVTRLTDTADAEDAPRFSPDGHRVAYVRGGQLFTLTFASGQVRQLTRERQVSADFSWSPDGRWIAAHASDPPSRFTSYPAYTGMLIGFVWARPNAPDVIAVPTGGEGAVRPLLPTPEREVFWDWAPDSSKVLLQRSSIDTKTRELLLVDVAEGRARSLYRQRDERYLATKEQAALFSPDGQSVLFTSDADGWNHLYVLGETGGDPIQVTSGPFEVSFPSWSPDGSTIYFSSSEEGTEQRHLYAVPSRGGNRRRLDTASGVNTTAILAPGGDRLAYIHSDPSHLPDLWIIGTTRGAKPRQLTDSMPPELKQLPWQTPRLVTYPGKGGLPIKAQLFAPSTERQGVRYPAVVHVHQAALYQEVFLGPGPQKDNVAWYGWHQRLAQQGYVVLNIDYRGSSGYGRDFRTGDHLVLGTDPIEDVVRGVDYLRTLGFVDTDRVGVYGMSTGGRMVLTLLGKYPGVFKAGINIAGGVDYFIEGGPWDLRNGWVYERLGDPDDHPEAFRSASAINFVDAIDAPVLTLQGTADTNVGLNNSLKLIDALLERGKPFEFEIYPGEVHFFARRRSWVDAFAKMERFLKSHLAPSDVSASPEK